MQSCPKRWPHLVATQRCGPVAPSGSMQIGHCVAEEGPWPSLLLLLLLLLLLEFSFSKLPLSSLSPLSSR